jgi:ATP-dependent Clp protease adapter protein ClpS
VCIGHIVYAPTVGNRFALVVNNDPRTPSHFTTAETDRFVGMSKWAFTKIMPLVGQPGLAAVARMFKAFW